MRSADRPHGIAWRTLVRERKRRLSDLHYELDLRIDRTARRLQARQTIDFTLAAVPRRWLRLDWRPEEGVLASAAIAASLRVNGQPASRAGARLAGPHLEIPPALLRAGRNRLEIRWQARIRDADSALVRFHDPVDGTRYVYTLLVPTDASSIFPCFDQPDLKARFTLTLRIAHDWRAVGNAPLVVSERSARSRVLRFATTEPISTYLFAFAAGPFRVLRATDPTIATRLWVRRSQAAHARAQRDEVLGLNEQALRSFGAYFAHRFPFAKYDLVLLPEFPFRGMEHAGATFLDERAALLAKDSGDEATLQRALLIFHETAHQWLGNLVTMASFDDLWIKEGFANFMAYKLAARTALRSHAEVSFHLLKASALRVDQGPGTRALHRVLLDASAAKAAYGPIVYGKAPAVLRQLESRLGAERFRRGVRRLVRRHAYRSVDWRELIAAMEGDAGDSLTHWAQCWIARPGVPAIAVKLSDAVAPHRLDLEPQAGRSGSRPLLLEIEFEGARGRLQRRIALGATTATVPIPASLGPMIRVRVDPNDTAYALVRMRTEEVATMARGLPSMRRPLHRMQIWQALWQAVREGSLSPARFVAHALEALPREDNEIVLRAVFAMAQTVSARLLEDPPRTLIDGLDAMVSEGLLDARSPARARAWFDALLLLARGPLACDLLCEIAHGQRMLAHARIEPEHRVLAAAAATVHGTSIEWRRLLTDLPNRGARRKAELLWAAASPRSRSKRMVFERYLSDLTLAEDWIVASLPYFNHPAHAPLTLPLLARALAALPDVARTKKLFFVDRWLESFLGGQHGAQALARARAALANTALGPDLALKARTGIAELRRVVAIRSRYSARDKTRDATAARERMP